jgi:peptide/nickel transport system permease protein
MLVQWGARRVILIFSLTILGLLVFTAILAQWIAPYDPRKGDLDDKNTPPAWLGAQTEQRTVVDGFPDDEATQISLNRASNLAVSGKVIDLQGNLLSREQVAPGGQVLEVIRPAGSAKFLLGADDLGRDLLSRIIWGARVSLIVAAVTILVGGSIGTALGLVSGYYGGWADEVIMRMVDIFLALPLVMVALVLVVVLGNFSLPLLPMKEIHMIAMVLSLFIWVRFARQVRGEVLGLKTMDYVALARVAGASTRRILLVHLLPGVLNTVIVVGTLQVSTVILLESILSFLGAGVAPPTPAWGSMVADGRDFLKTAWWVSTMPGLALLLTVMAFNLIGDWIRDALDPRLRQQV